MRKSGFLITVIDPIFGFRRIVGSTMAETADRALGNVCFKNPQLRNIPRENFEITMIAVLPRAVGQTVMGDPLPTQFSQGPSKNQQLTFGDFLKPKPVF